MATTGKSYGRQIRRKISGDESQADVIKMIDILTRERFNALKQTGKLKTVKRPSKHQSDFAAGVLCFLLDPIKTSEYKESMTEFREDFKGIAQNKELQNEFREALSEKLLLQTVNTKEAIQEVNQLGIGKLLRKRGSQVHVSGIVDGMVAT